MTEGRYPAGNQEIVDLAKEMLNSEVELLPTSARHFISYRPISMMIITKGFADQETK